MTPTYSMPSGPAALHSAALLDLRSALDAIRCATVLLATRDVRPPGRQILAALLQATAKAEAASSRLESAAALMRRKGEEEVGVASASVGEASRPDPGPDAAR